MPKGWAGTTIADIADTRLGKMLDAAKNKGDAVPYLRNVNVRWGAFDLSNLFNMRVTSDEYDELAVQDGDLFVCEGGEPGRSAVWRSGPQRIVFQKALHRIRPLGGVEPDYLARHLKHAVDSGAVSHLLTGTTIRHLPQIALQRIQVNVPPKAEQRRIVTKLDALTARLARARAELDRVPLLAARLRKEALSKAIAGQLVDGLDQNGWSKSDYGAISARRKAYIGARRGSRLHTGLDTTLGWLSGKQSGWLGCRLADVVTLRVGYAFKSTDFKKGDGIPLLRGANVAPGTVDWTDRVCLPSQIAMNFSQYALSKGDIVIAMDRPIISTGLKVAQIDEDSAGSLLVQRVANLRPTEWILADYLLLILRSPLFIKQIEEHSTGSDLPHISANDILTTSAPLPPLRVQQSICDTVSATFARADRLESEAARARALLDRLEAAILAKAFRGELVPQDPNDEPASVLLDRIRAERAAAPKSKRGRRAAADA